MLCRLAPPEALHSDSLRQVCSLGTATCVCEQVFWARPDLCAHAAESHREAVAAQQGQQTGRIGPWHRGGLLGSGGFGRVYLAIAANGADGHQLFAVKQVSLSSLLTRPCTGGAQAQ